MLNGDLKLRCQQGRRHARWVCLGCRTGVSPISWYLTPCSLLFRGMDMNIEELKASPSKEHRGDLFGDIEIVLES